jgi:hypothetical protein
VKIRKYRLSSQIFFFIIFLTFLGYYDILLIAINSGLGGYTRQVTIPLRLLIVGGLVSLILLNFKRARFTSTSKWFLLFSILFLCRIIVDFYAREFYYLSTPEILFYFFSFAVIPFIALNAFQLDDKSISLAINAIFLSGMIFSVLVILSYGRFVGQVGRLASSTAGEDVISPLALSYCATLVIGTLLTYILYNKVSKFKRLLMLLTVVLSVIPFFLGASRGSLIALFIPFLLMILSGRSLIFIFNSTLGLFCLGIALFYLDSALGSGLFTRFLGISDAVEQGSSSASRVDIWAASFRQFLDNPFFGDKLRVGSYDSYPHNLFLEVLQTNGIAGFIPFVILTGASVKLSFKIFKKSPEHSWIAILFLQNLVHNMFSGAVYNAVWFWTSMALVFSVGQLIEDRSVRHFKKYENRLKRVVQNG